MSKIEGARTAGVDEGRLILAICGESLGLGSWHQVRIVELKSTKYYGNDLISYTAINSNVPDNM